MATGRLLALSSGELDSFVDFEGRVVCPFAGAPSAETFKLLIDEESPILEITSQSLSFEGVEISSSSDAL